MSDDLRRILGEMREDLRAVHAEQRGIRERMEVAESRFSTFVSRFDEVAEMLITHDTEQLQRVVAVENENAAMRQQWQDLARRLEALEKRAG